MPMQTAYISSRCKLLHSYIGALTAHNFPDQTKALKKHLIFSNNEHQFIKYKLISIFYVAYLNI